MERARSLADEVSHREPTLEEAIECALKTALLEDIKSANAELVEIHDREVQALIAEDFTRVADYAMLLQQARARQPELIAQYRIHLITHGC